MVSRHLELPGSPGLLPHNPWSKNWKAFRFFQNFGQTEIFPSKFGVQMLGIRPVKMISASVGWGFLSTIYLHLATVFALFGFPHQGISKSPVTNASLAYNIWVLPALNLFPVMLSVVDIRSTRWFGPGIKSQSIVLPLNSSLNSVKESVRQPHRSAP